MSVHETIIYTFTHLIERTLQNEIPIGLCQSGIRIRLPRTPRQYRQPDGSWAHHPQGRAVTVLEVVWANEGEGDIEEELAEYRSEQINVILLKLEWRGVGGEAAVCNLPRLPAEFEDWRGKARVSVVLQDWERQGWEQYNLSAPVRNLPDGVREVNRRQRVLPLPTRWFVDPLPGAPERFPVFLEDFVQVLKDRLLPACVQGHAPERQSIDELRAERERLADQLGFLNRNRRRLAEQGLTPPVPGNNRWERAIDLREAQIQAAADRPM